MFESIYAIFSTLSVGLVLSGFLLTAREFSRMQPARARSAPERR
jgi:hypothetical protein